MSSHAAPADPRALSRRLTLPRLGGEVPATVAFGAVLTAIALRAEGGLQLGPLTQVEIAVDLGAGVLGAGALLAGGRTRRPWGTVALALFGALVALSALSILWAVEPSEAWIESARTLSHFAVFGAGLALVRLVPGRWGALLGGTVLAAVAISAYALLTKVLPGALNSEEVYARLREPFGYWNSVGLMAALGAPGCLWLGARRSGHAALNALAYPALGLLVVTCLLAYSRGSLLALGVACACWFAIVPLRLRAAAVLGTSTLGAALVALWAFGEDALSEDRIPLAAREGAGEQLGLLLVAMLVLLLAAGLAIGFALAHRSPSATARQRAGIAVLVGLALVPVTLTGALALSDRGLGGSISEGWNSLTDPDASTPANAPDRLTAVGSVRARYWNEALKIWKADKALGAGAGGYATVRPRYREDTLDVRHAHGYVVQTMADLGLVGLAVSLALLAAWLAAAGRAIGLWGPAREARWSAERVGLATLATVVVAFGVHSFVDWTWFVPGNAMPALLCAGWVAGRGPVNERFEGFGRGGAAGARLRAGLRDRGRALVAAVALLTAVLAAWTTWQPRRAVDAGNDALAALERRDVAGARAAAERERDVNPLSVDALYDRAAVELAARDESAARRAYVAAVELQPSNPEPWLRLAQFELYTADRPDAALRILRAALYLDPRSPAAITAFLDATRQASGG